MISGFIKAGTIVNQRPGRGHVEEHKQQGMAPRQAHREINASAMTHETCHEGAKTGIDKKSHRALTWYGRRNKQLMLVVHASPDCSKLQ
eukprot:4904241-Amphidinium_carterae.1